MDERSLIRYLRTRTKTGDGRRWGCPDESQIAAYASGQVGEPEREKMEAHLADCNFCLGQVAFLARIEKAKLPDSVPPSLLARARDLAGSRARVALIPAWGRLATAAAVACLAVGVTVSVRYSHLRTPTPSATNHPGVPSTGTPSSTQPEVSNSAAATGEVRGGTGNAPLTVVFPASGSVVPRKDLQLRWEAVRGALYYDVRVMTTEGNLVWEQRVDANSLKVPADVKLEAGGKYYLLLRADLPEGKTVESKTVAFSVADQN
ncbi:MAG TPA: hypothetical protein VG204_07045 [Terriglobia bacterium]|nr:hypothetical protein [Terriglobia bacterium]